MNRKTLFSYLAWNSTVPGVTLLGSAFTHDWRASEKAPMWPIRHTLSDSANAIGLFCKLLLGSCQTAAEMGTY